MSHNVETMAYANETPWHGLGFSVADSLTPAEMMIASKTNWTVSLAPVFKKINGEYLPVESNNTLLVRDSDGAELDMVGTDWVPNQNEVAFELFDEFVQKGDMKMETAGSLQGGKIVWAMAKVRSGFTLFGGDRVESYLLFTNPHKYGWSISALYTPVRVVCNNTLTMALGGKANTIFKSSHRKAVDLNEVKEVLGLAQKKQDRYCELASFLGSKEYSDEAVLDFFNQVFPSMSAKGEKKESRNAKQAILALAHQPGIEYAPNSWWQALNAVTYVTDHIMGRNADNRVYNMWMGTTKDTKLRAAELAADFAKAA